MRQLREDAQRRLRRLGHARQRHRRQPGDPASEATVTLTLTNANRHARRSGDIVDQDAAKKGVQPRGFVYTVAAGDAFKLRLHGYEGTDTPVARRPRPRRSVASR